MDIIERYHSLKIDGSLISLESGETAYSYFCYPINAKPIGFEGSIMYCFIEPYGEMVFACNPDTCADTYVYPLAANFEEFIRLILACGSTNPIEQIVWMRKEQFDEHLKSEREIQTKEQQNVLAILAHEFVLTPMDNPFEYVKTLQENFDGTKIQYSDEYYDVLGIER